MLPRLRGGAQASVAFGPRGTDIQLPLLAAGGRLSAVHWFPENLRGCFGAGDLPRCLWRGLRSQGAGKFEEVIRRSRLEVLSLSEALLEQLALVCRGRPTLAEARHAPRKQRQSSSSAEMRPTRSQALEGPELSSDSAVFEVAVSSTTDLRPCNSLFVGSTTCGEDDATCCGTDCIQKVSFLDPSRYGLRR